jgi:translation initiation factor 3 subunit G
MSRWADADDEDIPPPSFRTALSKDSYAETVFSIDSQTGLRKKTVTKVQVATVQRRRSNRVADRRQRMVYFGAASADQENVTIQSRDEMLIEDPKAAESAGPDGEDASKALAGNLNAFWAKQQRRQLERKYDVTDGPEDEEGAEGDAAGASAGGKYVPPGQRGGGAASGGKSLASMEAALGPDDGQRKFDDRDANTIRCTNISEDTTEANLQDLFSPFGRISRVYLAKDRETMTSRGFAFISFVHHEDAANAMEALQGYGYDHLILKLEWARPTGGGKDGNAGGERTEYRSGYGKALAQDTKEKVSYASNLTANR